MSRTAWMRKMLLKITPSVLPNNVSKLTGNHKEGPNCWNATMLFFNPKEEIRFVPPTEMIEWLEENTVKDDMKLCKPGTIIVLYNEDCQHTVDGLIHTAVYVAPGVLWHKRGMGGPWELVTEKELRAIYFETQRFEYRLFKEAA